MGVLSAVGKSVWSSKKYGHPIKLKVPSDEVHILLVYKPGSAIALESTTTIVNAAVNTTRPRKYEVIALTVSCILDEYEGT